MKNIKELDEVGNQWTDYAANSLNFEFDAEMTLNSEYDLEDTIDESINKIMPEKKSKYEKNISYVPKYR